MTWVFVFLEVFHLGSRDPSAHVGGSKAWMSGRMDGCLLSLKANLENYVGQMGKVVRNEGELFIDSEDIYFPVRIEKIQ